MTAGRPSLLQTDHTPHADEILGPTVEWPPGPPTVERLNRRQPDDESHVDTASASVVDLSTTRSLRLLQATLEHLETTVEMGVAQGQADVAGLQDAIQHLHRAKVCLTDLVACPSPGDPPTPR